MTQTSSFALRMPSEIKDAAKSLTNISFYEPSTKHKSYFNHVSPRSINDALVYLMRKGLEETIKYIDVELKNYNDRIEISQEMMIFFMSNPAASELRTVNLVEGSRARVHLEKLQAHHEKNVDALDADERYDVVTRRETSDEYAHEQKIIYELTEAKGFIQKALIAKIK